MAGTLFCHPKSLFTKRKLLAAKLRRARRTMGSVAARHYYLAGRFGPALPRPSQSREYRPARRERRGGRYSCEFCPAAGGGCCVCS